MAQVILDDDRLRKANEARTRDAAASITKEPGSGMTVTEAAGASICDQGTTPFGKSSWNRANPSPEEDPEAVKVAVPRAVALKLSHPNRAHSVFPGVPDIVLPPRSATRPAESSIVPEEKTPYVDPWFRPVASNLSVLYRRFKKPPEMPRGGMLMSLVQTSRKKALPKETSTRAVGSVAAASLAERPDTGQSRRSTRFSACAPTTARTRVRKAATEMIRARLIDVSFLEKCQPFFGGLESDRTIVPNLYKCDYHKRSLRTSS
jgi:hypothetical protein